MHPELEEYALHAVWVEANTVPGIAKFGIALCGRVCPYVVAGIRGGHDWERYETREQCETCIFILENL